MEKYGFVESENRRPKTVKTAVKKKPTTKRVTSKAKKPAAKKKALAKRRC